MDQFNFNNFPDTNFNEANLSWMLEVMSQFKEDLESGQFVGPQGPQGEPGPAGDGITEEVKQALLQLARKVAYIDDQGQTYYQDLYDALYGVTPAELVSISAAYTQTGTVYDTDSLESLKADLIVTATYSDSSTAVIPAADYTLSGSLTVGTSTITVSYQGKTATFQVTVTAGEVTLVSISAAFNQGSAVIYDSDSLDTLKQYLTVTATYSDSSTATIPSTDYTLSGTLTEGASTVTVSYRGETATFQVTVTADPVPVTLVSISAAFNQGSAVIYDSDSLDTLKQYLTVTATYSDSSTAVIPSTDYTLSGTLTEGTSTITVSYQGKTTTFTVTVSGIGTTLFSSLVWRDFTNTLGTFTTTNNNGDLSINAAVTKENTSAGWNIGTGTNGPGDAQPTFADVAGHTIRLYFDSNWTEYTDPDANRLVVSLHFSTGASYSATRLRYITLQSIYPNTQDGYADVVVPASGWTDWDGTGTVADTSSFGVRIYFHAPTGTAATFNLRFVDMGVV